jgi:signal peptide peptidase SppA
MKKFILALGLLATIAICPADWSLFSTKPAKVPAEIKVKPVKAHIAVVDFCQDANLKKMAFQLRDLARDPQIHGILLMIDNTGGSANQFTPVHDMIKKIREIKPVVGLVNGNVQSGGYWVASAVDYLIVSSAAEIGMIGVLFTVDRYTDSKVVDKVTASLQVELFKAGKYKAVTHPYAEKLSDDEKHYVQQNVDKVYKMFVNAVAANRGLDLENSHEWAEGKEFNPQEALELGLVDEIGTIFGAENKLVELIRGKQPAVTFEDTVELVFSAMTVSSEKLVASENPVA